MYYVRVSSLLCTQSKATDLFAAACSGNIDLFDLLVQKFDLPPDQWMEVCVGYICMVKRIHSHHFMLYVGTRWIFQCSHPSSHVGTPCNGEAPHSKVQMWLAKAEQGVSLTFNAYTLRTCAVTHVLILVRMSGRCCTLLCVVEVLSWLIGWSKNWALMCIRWQRSGGLVLVIVYKLWPFELGPDHAAYSTHACAYALGWLFVCLASSSIWKNWAVSPFGQQVPVWPKSCGR